MQSNDPRYGNGQAQNPYAQQYPQQQYPQQQPYGAPQQQQPQQYGGPQPGFQMPSVPGLGSMGGLGGLGNAIGRAGAGVPQPSGLPAALAFALGIGAVVLALVFDVVFLNIHIPGVGGYAWYLSTALTFAGAGYAGAKWTRATRTTAMVAIGIAGARRGLGLGLVLRPRVRLRHLPRAQGVVIALVTGFDGIHHAASATRVMLSRPCQLRRQLGDATVPTCGLPARRRPRKRCGMLLR